MTMPSNEWHRALLRISQYLIQEMALCRQTTSHHYQVWVNIIPELELEMVKMKTELELKTLEL